MQRTLQCLVLVMAAALGVCLAGCGERGHRIPETGATLEGTITYGKEKVPVAVVRVMGKKGMGEGTVGEDGRYKVENAPLGEVTIAVDTAAARGDLESRRRGAVYSGPGGKKQPAAPAPKFVEVPAKFANHETSGVTTTISKGVNNYDIALPR